MPGSLGTASLKNADGQTGNIPVVPVPMSQMSPIVKTTVDAITAAGGMSGAVKLSPSTSFTLKSGYSLVVSRHYVIPENVVLTLEADSILHIL